MKDKSFIRKQNRIKDLRSHQPPIIKPKSEKSLHEENIHEMPVTLKEIEESKSELMEVQKDPSEIIDLEDVGKISDNGDQISQIDNHIGSEKEYHLQDEHHEANQVDYRLHNPEVEEYEKADSHKIEPEQPIGTIIEVDREYTENSFSRHQKKSSQNDFYGVDKHRSNNNSHSNKPPSKVESFYAKEHLSERKKSLIRTKERLKEELNHLKGKLERKREESRSRSMLSVNDSQIASRKGLRNIKKSQNSKLIVEEIEK